MSALYHVVPSSVLHVKALSSHLREQECATLKAFGTNAREALRRAFASSSYARTAVLDGRPCAMWGYSCTTLSQHALVWVAFGIMARKYPLAITKRARIELDAMAYRAGLLYARISREDGRAMVFASHLGFIPCHDTEDDRMALMVYGAR